MNRKHIAYGDLMMLAATMIFGAMTIFSKQILAELEVFNMVALRFLIAFAACIAVFRKRYSRLDMKTFLHSGVLGTFLFASYLCMVLGCKMGVDHRAAGQRQEVDKKCRLNWEANSGSRC